MRLLIRNATSALSPIDPYRSMYELVQAIDDIRSLAGRARRTWLCRRQSGHETGSAVARQEQRRNLGLAAERFRRPRKRVALMGLRPRMLSKLEARRHAERYAPAVAQRRHWRTLQLGDEWTDRVASRVALVAMRPHLQPGLESGG